MGSMLSILASNRRQARWSDAQRRKRFGVRFRGAAEGFGLDDDDEECGLVRLMVWIGRQLEPLLLSLVWPRWFDVMLEMVVKGFELEREFEACGRSTVSSGAIHGCVWELGAWWLRW